MEIFLKLKPILPKAEDIQMDCFTCHEEVIERLPFLGGSFH